MSTICDDTVGHLPPPGGKAPSGPSGEVTDVEMPTVLARQIAVDSMSPQQMAAQHASVLEQVKKTATGLDRGQVYQAFQQPDQGDQPPTIVGVFPVTQTSQTSQVVDDGVLDLTMKGEAQVTMETEEGAKVQWGDTVMEADATRTYMIDPWLSQRQTGVEASQAVEGRPQRRRSALDAWGDGAKFFGSDDHSFHEDDNQSIGKKRRWGRYARGGGRGGASNGRGLDSGSSSCDDERSPRRVQQLKEKLATVDRKLEQAALREKVETTVRDQVDGSFQEKQAALLKRKVGDVYVTSEYEDCTKLYLSSLEEYVGRTIPVDGHDERMTVLTSNLSMLEHSMITKLAKLDLQTCHGEALKDMTVSMILHTRGVSGSYTRSDVYHVLFDKIEGVKPADIVSISPTARNNEWHVIFANDPSRRAVIMADVDFGGYPVRFRAHGNSLIEVRIHWVPLHVKWSPLVAILSQWGIVKEAYWDYSKIEECRDIKTGVRVFLLETSDVSAIPAQPLSFPYGNERVQALITLPGHGAVCWGCNLRGHVRRDCPEKRSYAGVARDPVSWPKPQRPEPKSVVEKASSGPPKMDPKEPQVPVPPLVPVSKSVASAQSGTSGGKVFAKDTSSNTGSSKPVLEGGRGKSPTRRGSSGSPSHPVNVRENRNGSPGGSKGEGIKTGFQMVEGRKRKKKGKPQTSGYNSDVSDKLVIDET